MTYINLTNGDCIESLKTLPDGSVDLILTDPPYGIIKDLSIKGGTSAEWDVKIPQHAMLAECSRVLRVNGALLLFSQDPFTAELMTGANGNLPFAYRMTWLKDTFGNPLLAKTAPVSFTEDICVFFKKYDTNRLHPLRSYVSELFADIGLPKATLFGLMGHQGVDHFMRADSPQFSLCTEKTYTELILLFGIDRRPGFMTYRQMADVDADVAAAYSRTFNLNGRGSVSNVLKYPKDRPSLHPTQKPVALLEDLINTYSNAGDTVVDFTMGSGSTGVACFNTGRSFRGTERDPVIFETARNRIAVAASTLGTRVDLQFI